MKIRIFWKNPAPSLFSFHRPLTTCQVLEKSNEQIPIKVRHRRTNGRTNGRTDWTEFIEPLLDKVGGINRGAILHFHHSKPGQA